MTGSKKQRGDDLISYLHREARLDTIFGVIIVALLSVVIWYLAIRHG